MRDIASRPLIVGKGLLFLGLAGASAILLFLEDATWKTALLLAVLIWASCRFYYFVFYALHRYVDPNLRYAGLRALISQIRRGRDRVVSAGGGETGGGAGPSGTGAR
jgi:hypothetical protein